MGMRSNQLHSYSTTPANVLRIAAQPKNELPLFAFDFSVLTEAVIRIRRCFGCWGRAAV